jgi:hypothetical protein
MVMDELKVLISYVYVSNPGIGEKILNSFIKFYTEIPIVKVYSTPNSNIMWNLLMMENEEYNNLSLMALSTLVTPASEVACERVFSKLKYMVGDKRWRLSPENTFFLLLLNMHLENIKLK